MKLRGSLSLMGSESYIYCYLTSSETSDSLKGVPHGVVLKDASHVVETGNDKRDVICPIHFWKRNILSKNLGIFFWGYYECNKIGYHGLDEIGVNWVQENEPATVSGYHAF